MQIEILGSAGAIPTPRPGCVCRVCAVAREKGIPHARTGPSLFVHGPNLLVDTPEEIRLQIDRSQVTRIDACVYSHWHPDHTMGLRVFSTINGDFLGWPPRSGKTPLYFPEQVALDLRSKLKLWSVFEFMAKHGYVEIHELIDGETFSVNGATVRPQRLAEDYVYAFVIEHQGRRVFIAPDELNDWSPPAELGELDLAVIPMGIPEYHPITGERMIHADHPVLKSEATFDETLKMVESMAAKRVVMTHIEEPCALTHDDLLVVEASLRRQGLDVVFAYDTMMLDV